MQKTKNIWLIFFSILALMSSVHHHAPVTPNVGSPLQREDACSQHNIVRLNNNVSAISVIFLLQLSYY